MSKIISQEFIQNEFLKKFVSKNEYDFDDEDNLNFNHDRRIPSRYLIPENS
jgi:hypothetical protein